MLLLVMAVVLMPYIAAADEEPACGCHNGSCSGHCDNITRKVGESTYAWKAPSAENTMISACA